MMLYQDGEKIEKIIVYYELYLQNMQTLNFKISGVSLHDYGCTLKV